MVIQVNDMIRDVRIAMDMNESDDSLLLAGDSNTLDLDRLIESNLSDAVRLVELAAPYTMLEKGHTFGDSIEWEGEGRGWCILPDDFLRIVVFKMSDWRHAVFTPIAENDPLYPRLSSPYRGISGTPERPICAIVNRPEGVALEFYTCDSVSAEVEQAVYVPYPRIDCNGGIDISERCYKAAVYKAAALTLASLNDAQSQTLDGISGSLLGI